MDESAIHGWTCCFCGEGEDGEPELTIGAHSFSGNVEQYWWAHRRCLLDRMAEVVRSAGGPLVDD